MASKLSISDKIAWLRLIRTENVGPVTFYRLLEQFGSAQAALEALPELAKKGGRKKKLLAVSKSKIEDEFDRIDQIGGQFVFRDDEYYPPLLAQVDDAPPVLSLLGHPHLLRKKSIAVVGARNSSLNGCKIAGQLAEDLGKGGLCVVSGLARGVDGAAHAAALNTGTVGVLGGGVDVIYPRENETLYKRMCEQGALIAEPPMGVQPQARHFPRRNRIISGMCRAIVVVEASPKSGSLITARLALEQGREVFAVPGSPLDPRSKGTNGLIREGALLVESANDIFNTIHSWENNPLKERLMPYNISNNTYVAGEDECGDVRDKIRESLTFVPVFVDEIIRQCHVSPAVVHSVLLELELAGRLERHPGNMVSLLAE